MPHLNARAKFWGSDTGHSIHFTRRRSRNQELLSRFRAVAPPNRSRAATHLSGERTRLAEMPFLVQAKKVVGGAPTTAREGACAPQTCIATAEMGRQRKR